MTGPDSGEISATFQNAAGDEISVTGKAKNGTMASLNAKRVVKSLFLLSSSQIPHGIPSKNNQE
jgi:hypothetical protein